MKKHINLILSVIIILITIFTSGCSKDSAGTKEEPILDEKPVIYLYGYDGQDATVSLNVNGTLTSVYPAPSSKDISTATWNVTGKENGLITVNNTDYRYLFWEGELNQDWSFDKGFCVSGSGTMNFLENKLKSLGLNAQEIEDFVTYWGPRMQNNPYNVISFQTKMYTDTAGLTVTPKPDTTLRIFMAWHPSNTNVNLPAQTFKIPARKGKVIVEWGGAEIPDEADPEDIYLPGSVTPGTVVLPQAAPAATADPYAQYGTYAQCAKAWDQTGAKRSGQTWAQLDAGTRQAAYNHWIGHGTDGW